MSIKILQGNALDVLTTLSDESVHCVVTSPPYYGLRDYGDPKQIGLEPSPDEYVAALVAVFREVQRVLRNDGTLWLNLGDSYYATSRGTSSTMGSKSSTFHGQSKQFHPVKPIYLKMPNAVKPKDLIGIPWMLAFALRNDGWYLRSEIIWSKANPMPESVRDRPTSAHEKIFLFSKSERYYYDADAVKETAVSGPSVRDKNAEGYSADYSKGERFSAGARVYGEDGNRNLRNVWHLTHEPFADAHFATYPSKIPERAIMAGSSEKGCCSKCGAPWSRCVELIEQKSDGLLGLFESKKVKTIQWKPTCSCNANVVPCTILDPFNGAATTGLVAARLARNYIGIELNPKYVDISNKRLDNRAGLFMEFLS